MKYPWVALSLIIVWFSTTYIILKRGDISVYKFLLAALIGTIVIAVIGFRPSKVSS
ncbi:MAG TPA: hypothetical protein VJJ73_02650 [Candidatus Paceibacterota bacterium]